MKTDATPQWQFTALKDIDANQLCNRLAADINRVTKDAFLGTVTLNKGALKRSLKNSTHIGLVHIDSNLGGFCLLTINEKRRLNNRLVLWIDKIAISFKAQGNGLGMSVLLHDLQQIINLEELGYIGCCTQNSGLINALSSLGCRSYPITDDYGTRHGVGVWTYLTINIPQIKARLAEHADELDELLLSNHGIMKKGFPHRLNVSPYPLKQHISEKLKARDFDEDNGDLIIMLTEL